MIDEFRMEERGRAEEVELEMLEEVKRKRTDVAMVDFVSG
jgi:hypothetical protein